MYLGHNNRGLNNTVGPALFLGNSLQGITLAAPTGGSPSWWQEFTGTDTKYGNVLPRAPSSPWGGTAGFTDQIQIIGGGASYNTDISNAIVTDNTVPAGVSNQVLQQTLITAYGDGGQATQNTYMVQPDSSVAQGMLYTRFWAWLQADMTSRGQFQLEIAEFKTPDGNGSTLGPERFQMMITQESWAFGATTPCFTFAHNTAYGYPGGGFYNFSDTYIGPVTHGTTIGPGTVYDPVPVPLGHWFKVEFAWNRSDANGNGWMWSAITDPQSGDPNLVAGQQIFAAYGAYSFRDNNNSITWTNGLNPAPAYGGYSQGPQYINRIYLFNMSYGPITRGGASGNYVVGMTDMEVYAGWPLDATAHPATFN